VVAEESSHHDAPAGRDVATVPPWEGSKGGRIGGKIRMSLTPAATRVTSRVCQSGCAPVASRWGFRVAALEKALSPYIDAARKATSAPRRSTGKSSPRATPEDRKWLRSNSFPNVKDRGRLPSEATEALRNC